MDRRDALKALGSVAAAAGLTVTPVTVGEASEAALVILKSKRLLSADERDRLAAAWKHVVAGTALEHVRVAVLDADFELQLVNG